MKNPAYLRGLRHGLQLAARTAYSHNEGRSWTAGDIANAILAHLSGVGRAERTARKLINKRTDDIPLGIAPPEKTG